MLSTSISMIKYMYLQVQLEVDMKFVQDTLRDDDLTEIRTKFIKKLEDAVLAEFIYVSVLAISLRFIHNIRICKMQHV